MQIEKFPLKVTFYKKGEMIYFSQLDLFRILTRSLRRTSLPIYFTQGLSPHVKISFLNGLKLGLEGQIEVNFYFTKNITLTELRASLGVQLPQGLEII